MENEKQPKESSGLQLDSLNYSARRFEQFNEKISAANAAIKNCSFALADGNTKQKIKIFKAVIYQYEAAKNLLLESEKMLDEIIAELQDVPLFP